MTCTKNFTWVFPLLLVVVASSNFLSITRASGRVPQAKSPAPPPTGLAERIKFIGTTIDGSTAEVGNRSAKYDSYKYENFRFERCSLGWSETHESYEAKEFLSKQVQELTIPLATLSQASVRLDKIGAAAYLLSFTTLKLKQTMVSHVRSTNQQRNEEEYDGLQSGTGIYLQDEDAAQRVAKALVLSINSCQKGTDF